MQILLTGGSGCGKSTYAEKLAVRFPGPRYYLATMRPYDQECLDRIERHRAMRAGKGFETIERYTGLKDLVLPMAANTILHEVKPTTTPTAIRTKEMPVPSPQAKIAGTVLLECICNLVANEMFDEDGAVNPHAEEEILAGVENLASQCENLIVVTNDVGSGDGRYADSVLDYVALVGRINHILARKADRVAELCCGIPIAVKGDLF